jgi:hypothetical protein
MSAKSIKALETHRAAQGRPVPKPVDITGCAPKAKRPASFTAGGIRWGHQESKAMPVGS